MIGIVDVITLLLGLSGFGLQPNAKAPTADAVLEYAIPDADLVAHFDVASVIPGNYKKLVELADQPQFKSSPQLAKLVQEAVTEVNSARGLVKSMTNIDLTTDLADATAFVQDRPGMEPNIVVAAHGKFSASTIDKIAAIVHKPAVKLKNGAAWVSVDSTSAVAVTGDGVLLFGTQGLLGDRTRAEWKAPPHGAGTNLGYTAELLAGKPVFAVVMTLSQSARNDAVNGIGGANFLTDIVKRHKLASFALYRDGIGWQWIDSTKPGLDAMTDISNGMVDMLRAAQIAPRGFAKIMLGALESYRDDHQVDELLRHKADLMHLVDAYVGDGSFKAKVDADPKTLRLSVRLTGKSAADVVAFGMLIPVGMWAFLEKRSDSSSHPDWTTPAVPPPPPPPPLVPSPKKRP